MELGDIVMPSKQKFGDFILFEMYSPHIYIACHSNLASYFTFAVSLPGLFPVHYSCVIKRKWFVVSQRFAGHVIFMPFALPFPSVLAA